MNDDNMTPRNGRALSDAELRAYSLNDEVTSGTPPVSDTDRPGEEDIGFSGVSDTCPTCGSDKRGGRPYATDSNRAVVWEYSDPWHDEGTGHLPAEGYGQSPIPLRESYDATSTGCWIWNRSIGANGYGKMSCSRHGSTVAHRAVYQDLVGEIPDGMELDHLCSNRACVNPSHMEVVTRGENIRRSGKTKLTAEKVVEIRKHLDAGDSHSKVARGFGVSKSAIDHIAAGRTWADV